MIGSGNIDIEEAWAYVTKMMRLTRASAGLEFAVVSAVRTYLSTSFCFRAIRLIAPMCLSNQTYILLLIELSSYLRENLLSGRT